MPVLISGLRTFVAFYLRIDDPLPFDGTNPSAWDPRPEIGVVEFKRVASVKKGSPNDEVLHGHPLWGSGLEFYQAHEVRNSPWIKELTDVNRVHGGFDRAARTGRAISYSRSMTKQSNAWPRKRSREPSRQPPPCRK
jgi:hypothetical protein